MAELSESEEAPGARRSVSFGGLLAAGGWFALAVAAVSAVGQRVWPLELIVHFWPQLAIALLVTSVASLLVGSRKGAAAQALGAALLIAFVMGSVIRASSGRGRDSDRSPVTTPAASPVPTPGGGVEPELGALFANVGRWNIHHERLLELIRRVRPDVVGLAEIDEAWLEALAPLREAYPYQVRAPRDDNFGLAFLSRLPISRDSIAPIGRLDLPTILATVETPGGPWRLIVTHPVPPFHAAAMASRNDQIAGLAAVLRAEDAPAVLLGDLNATLWSPIVRDLLDRAELRSAGPGLRGLYTWPTGLPFLALGLDHCLFTSPAVAIRFRVLESIRSDHFPILCTLARRPASWSPRGDRSSSAPRPHHDRTALLGVGIGELGR